MDQRLSFELKIPGDNSVKFYQEETFENFIGQFQRFCPKLICIVNGTILRYYDRTSSLPNNIRFDYKQRRGTVTEYYFRDNNDDTLYCVFGREAASIFYPRINFVDPITNLQTNTRANSSQTLVNNNSQIIKENLQYGDYSTKSSNLLSQTINLYNKNERSTIGHEMLSLNSFPDNSLDRTAINPVRHGKNNISSVIGSNNSMGINSQNTKGHNNIAIHEVHINKQQGEIPASCKINGPEDILQQDDTLLRNKIDNDHVPINNHLCPMGISLTSDIYGQKDSNLNSGQEKPIDSSQFHVSTRPNDMNMETSIVPKRQPLIQPAKLSIPLFRELPKTQTKLNYEKNSEIKIPKQIVIIDKGVKLTFPNPNYLVEIRTYNSS